MLLVVIISAATVMRYVLEMDLYGYEEWIKIFAFWLYFMGAGFGAYAGTHVSADLVQSYVKEGTFKRLLIFTKTFITLGVTLLFTWYGYDFFIFGFTERSAPAWRSPKNCHGASALDGVLCYICRSSFYVILLHLGLNQSWKSPFYRR